MDTKERLQSMDDFQVVRFFESFGQNLAAGARGSVAELKAGIPGSVRKAAGFDRLERLTPDQAEATLEPSESAAMARQVLMLLADDPTFAPLLQSSVESYRDDELVVDVILAVGLVATVLLLAASIEFQGTICGIKFKKRPVNPELLKALLSPIATIFGRMGT